MIDLGNNNKQEEALLFLHIPKAGGSTLNAILYQQYEQEEICKIDKKNIDGFSSISEEKKKQFKLIKGHFHFGLHEFLPQKYNYVTMLRDPTERVISLYYYIRSSPDHYLHKQLMSNQMTLEEFVSSGILKNTDNGQTRFISGQKKLEFGSTSQDNLDIAKDNLSKMAVVGTLENFDEALILIKKTFGWKNIFYTRQNITKSRLSQKEISQSTLETIVQYNHLDQELYKYAQSLLKQQISQCQPFFALELTNFKLLNKSYQAYRNLRYKTKALVRT